MAEPAKLTDDGRCVRVEGAAYTWTWTRDDDRFEVHDPAGRRVVGGAAQPAVLVRRGGERVCAAGVVGDHLVSGDRVEIGYDGVNGDAAATLAWRFDATGFWIEPVRYESDRAEDVVSLHWFAAAGSDPRPTLSSAFLVHPGVCESPALGPVVPTGAHLDLTTWLGRGAPEPGGPHQQWGLPAHWFCGYDVAGLPLLAGDVGTRLSDTYCCGLAELPAGDLMLRIVPRGAAPVLRVRSDQWGHVRGPGRLDLGPRWRVSFGADDRAAVSAYLRDLVAAGVVGGVAAPSPRKAETLRRSQLNTWGAQIATGTLTDRFDQATLETIYAEYTALDPEPGLFVVDDKWEGRYGVLEHDQDRFPGFEAFLDRVRADGHRIGLWAAFLRCDDPAALGLGPEHMLGGRDGVHVIGSGGYGLYDVTHPDVRAALRDCVHRFMRRYRPALVKFDFGYELPSLSAACPHDPAAAGERLLGVALDLLVGAMREVDPDVVVMYYGLSPLLAGTVDVHSTDDLFLATGEFPAEANRRLYYASLLGELGVTSYGSSGYDTDGIEEIWFDSVALGPLGSLGSFATGRPEDRLTPVQAATYRGLSRLVRGPARYTAAALGHRRGAVAAGGRTSSWARYEDGRPVLVVLRPHGFAGATGCSRLSDGRGVLVEADTTAAVASLTADGLDRTTRLAVVTSGPGRVTVRHDGAEGAPVAIVHAAGRRVEVGALPVEDGRVRVTVPDRLPDGTPVEHVELTYGHVGTVAGSS